MNTQTSLLQLILCVCVCDGFMIGVSRVSLQSRTLPGPCLKIIPKRFLPQVSTGKLSSLVLGLPLSVACHQRSTLTFHSSDICNLNISHYL